MKIKDNSKKNLLMFGDVKCGTVIRFNDKVYIKVEPMYDVFERPVKVTISYNSRHDVEYENEYKAVNAIDLSNGKGTEFYYSEKVEVFENSYVSME